MDKQADGEKNCLNCKHQDFICEVKGCKDYKKWEQADGEYISREAVIDIIEDVCPIYGNDYRYILREKINELPSVAIPNKVGLIRAIQSVIESSDFPEDKVHRIELMIRGEQDE